MLWVRGGQSVRQAEVFVFAQRFMAVGVDVLPPLDPRRPVGGERDVMLREGVADGGYLGPIKGNQWLQESFECSVESEMD